MISYEIVESYLQGKTKKIIRQAMLDNGEKILQEIRLRVDKPICLKFNGQNYFPKLSGEEHIVSKDEFNTTLEKISRFSLYAFQDELKNGYLTIVGGHRVGLVGQTIVENGEIKSVKNLTSMNIRISHEIKGNVDNVIKYMKKECGHVLIISPPAMGKTTLLRELIKKLSNDLHKTVGVVDERREIATCDLGRLTDVIDSCPKSLAMTILLRSMSPEVIAVDEIGKQEDIEALEELVNCGVVVIATVHGLDLDDVTKKKNFNKLIDDNVFDRYIVMGNVPGTVCKIYDKEKNIIWSR